jgi:hypothetical protein
MPSNEMYLQQAEEYKVKGNEGFAQHDCKEAIQFYSQGIVSVDRIEPASAQSDTLKCTLLSNRAAARIKQYDRQPDASAASDLEEAIADCQTAYALCQSLDSKTIAPLRAKILYRSAKARFLSANVSRDSATNSSKTHDLLQDAAKDLLHLLRMEPNHTEGNALLKVIRQQHKSTQQSPVAQIVASLRSTSLSATDRTHQCKLLLGHMQNDPVHTGMEVGRIPDAVDALLQLCATSEIDPTDRMAVLLLQSLTLAASHHTPFVRAYLLPHQPTLATLATQLLHGLNHSQSHIDAVVSLLALWHHIILHADRDNEKEEISGATSLQYSDIIETCLTVLSKGIPPERPLLVRAVLDVVAVFTAGPDRERRIRTQHPSDVSTVLSASEIRQLTPPQLAAYKKRQHDVKTRDQAWAYERTRLLCSSVVPRLLSVAAQYCTEDPSVRREITVTLSRCLACLDPDVPDVVRPLWRTSADEDEPRVVEVYNEEDENESKVDPAALVSLPQQMERAILAAAILLTAQKESSAWVLSSTGWATASDDLTDLIQSQDAVAMWCAAELLQAAAVSEATRDTVTQLVSSGAMQVLLEAPQREVRSGAAAAVAKLGLADKSPEEGNLMGLLQAACELLEDRADEEENATSTGSHAAVHPIKSCAMSSVERAVEMITYLVAHTTIKEELAAGFGGSSGRPALELLVQAADLAGAGESMSGFSLASIFQLLAVTNEQLRKESFEGKEVTMEQYDEMQRMGKTEEEKEIMDQEKDTDTRAACGERIRKMARANVPRALVALTEQASETTLEQLVLTMNRMAEEVSVRGIMIQQGVLSSCIQLEKFESPSETEVMKKVIRLARHCIAKLLITTNPSLLTSAQTLGSVRPLILLVRDIKASDLQHFEALLAITNIASSGEDAKQRIITEKGISSLHFAMFSDHELVRRAATEAMCNLVPHEKMMEHLAEEEHMRLWFAFAVDYEDHYECARAAAGCLAMATQDEVIAQTVIRLEKFKQHTMTLLESGRLEIMHRALAMIYNLVLYGGEMLDKVVEVGLIDFCRAYIELQQHAPSVDEFSQEERPLIPVTVDISKKIVLAADKK